MMRMIKTYALSSLCIRNVLDAAGLYYLLIFVKLALYLSIDLAVKKLVYPEITNNIYFIIQINSHIQSQIIIK